MRVARPIVYSIERKSEEILSRLREGQRLDVDEMLLESGSRSELVATFMSLLELCRNGSIYLEEKEEKLSVVLGSALAPAAAGEEEADGDI